MAMRKKNNKKSLEKEEKKNNLFILPEETKRWISSLFLFLAAFIIILSFFGLAGVGGEVFVKAAVALIGKTIFIIPLIFIMVGMIILELIDRKPFVSLSLAILIFVVSLSGILGVLNLEKKDGGWLGYLISWPLWKVFGFWAAFSIFLVIFLVGCLIFFHLFSLKRKGVIKKKGESEELEETTKTYLEEKPEQKRENHLLRKIFAQKFKLKEISPSLSHLAANPLEIKKSSLSAKPLPIKLAAKELKPLEEALKELIPSLDLLESDKDVPSSGDIRVNSAIIKKTLQNFDIPVEMSEINIGPTVTQYTFKPADGVKLSQITNLNNDLALALAAHPIRIEAPVPGRSLVGVEIPNKKRAVIRLKNLLQDVISRVLHPILYFLSVAT